MPSSFSPPDARAARTFTESCSVLVVEDDHITAQLLRLLLERCGFVVHLAHSVAQALDVTAEAPIDLLVSDLGLPDGDGCDLLPQLRFTGPRLALAITGNDPGTEDQRCREAGFQAVHTKPLDLPRLLRALQQLRGA